MFETGLVAWHVRATRGVDAAWLWLADDRLTARGWLFARDPQEYLVEYRLATEPGFVTRRLEIASRTAAGKRRAVIERSRDGWLVDGSPRPDLAAALDCDIQGCPLTNTMPVRRHRLQLDAGDVELQVAFVRLPSLEVISSTQNYEHVTRSADGATVRYRSGTFTASIEFDLDGLVVSYPGLGAVRSAP